MNPLDDASSPGRRHLSTTDHPRDATGMRYVYAVTSRRAGGVSVGINLSPNRACNFRCAYCQVEGLVRGSSPAIELDLVRRELRDLLADLLHGDFMATRVPEPLRQLRDVAFSGDGEPTTSPDFAGAVEVVGEELERAGLLHKLPIVLITNGTMVLRPPVRAALERLATFHGEAWFKLDSATRAGQQAIHDTQVSPEAQLARLEACARACPTSIQTCMFARAGLPPSDAEQAAYLERIADLVARKVPIRRVLLYGLARRSFQPEANELSALPAAWLQGFGERILALGMPVQVSP